VNQEKKFLHEEHQAAAAITAITERANRKKIKKREKIKN
jgi:hypothetical protein